jgi:hypothetical protein
LIGGITDTGEKLRNISITTDSFITTKQIGQFDSAIYNHVSFYFGGNYHSVTVSLFIYRLLPNTNIDKHY